MALQFDNQHHHHLQQQPSDLIKFQEKNQDDGNFNNQKNIFVVGMKRISKFINSFLFETSIHGFVHIVRIGNHLIER